MFYRLKNKIQKIEFFLDKVIADLLWIDYHLPAETKSKKEQTGKIKTKLPDYPQGAELLVTG